jgi:hypothetical protein
LFPQFCQWMPWWRCQKDGTWVTFLMAHKASHRPFSYLKSWRKYIKTLLCSCRQRIRF